MSVKVVFFDRQRTRMVKDNLHIREIADIINLVDFTQKKCCGQKMRFLRTKESLGLKLCYNRTNLSNRKEKPCIR